MSSGRTHSSSSSGGHQTRPRPPPPSSSSSSDPQQHSIIKPVYKQFGEAPAHYVAGLGRGATGFTTRSDIGPAREATPLMAADGTTATSMHFATPSSLSSSSSQPLGYIAGSGRGATGFGQLQPPMPGGLSSHGLITAPPPPYPPHHIPHHHAGDEDDDDTAAAMAGTFDAWSGYNESGLLAATPRVYDRDDEEADSIWREVDERVGRRRKRQSGREAEHEQEEKTAAQQQKQVASGSLAHDIASTFADLKGSLAGVSEDEWSAIPDIGDYSVKRKRVDAYTPVPDTLLEKARQENMHLTSIDTATATTATSTATAATATATTAASDSTTDLRALGEARENIMKSQLKRLEDSVTGKTTVDPKGYITSLDSRSVLGAAEMGDLKKAQALLRNITRTNPGHAAGWISRCRVEELAGKMSSARSVIMEGCEACPDSEDMWLEAARLHPIDTAKAILAQSVQHVPLSVNIWIAAANLEHSTKAKRRVLRKALEMIPNSVKLWKEAVELEEPEDARVMLQRAVECIPGNVDLWLALARLEPYDGARRVLNRARQHMPTEPLIWIAAAELEEARGNAANVDRIVQKGIKSLQANQVTIKRDDWIRYAYRTEEAGHVATCHAIVRAIIGIAVEDVDRKHTWIDDARAAVKPEDPSEPSHVETARAIYAHALTVFPEKRSLWRRAAALEKDHGTRDSLLDLLRRAVQHCPQSEELWLMAAKEKWLAGDVQGAREILLESFKVNRDNEDIWLAAVKIEVSSGQYDDARSLLAKAREQAGTARVWMTSAVLERNLGNKKRELDLLEEGLQKFPRSAKMWIMRGQWEEHMAAQTSDKTESDRHIDRARQNYIAGLKQCVHSVALWLCAAKLEHKMGNVTRARALLEKARLRNPQIPELWIAAIRLEVQSKNEPNAQSLMAKALQDCPNAGTLLKESIELESRPKQRATGVQALRANPEHPAVLTAVTKLFWRERKIETARSWFKRAIAADKDYGDAWAHAYKFELLHGSEDQQREILEACVAADPHHGELWCYVSKQPDNHNLKTEELLKKVAGLVDVNSPFTEMTTYVSPSSVELSNRHEESSKARAGMMKTTATTGSSSSPSGKQPPNQ